MSSVIILRCNFFFSSCLFYSDGEPGISGDKETIRKWIEKVLSALVGAQQASDFKDLNKSELFDVLFG
jgi:hypothetical protein